jgi:hypothetical protein
VTIPKGKIQPTRTFNFAARDLNPVRSMDNTARFVSQLLSQNRWLEKAFAEGFIRNPQIEFQFYSDPEMAEITSDERTRALRETNALLISLTSSLNKMEVLEEKYSLASRTSSTNLPIVIGQAPSLLNSQVIVGESISLRSAMVSFAEEIGELISQKPVFESFDMVAIQSLNHFLKEATQVADEINSYLPLLLSNLGMEQSPRVAKIVLSNYRRFILPDLAFYLGALSH